jgi:hypothetical protein
MTPAKLQHLKEHLATFTLSYFQLYSVLIDECSWSSKDDLTYTY